MSWTVIGQDGATGVLTSAVRNGRVAHAYVFAGPGRVGKTMTALQFAQLLNCTGDDPPCGRCRDCERIASMRHPDVELVTLGGLCSKTRLTQDDDDPGERHDHAKDNSRDIRICQIWRLQEVVSRAPYEGRYRVLIIDPADRMNRESFGALLKVLEEPPSYVVMVLVTDREEALPDTIRSRARRVAFTGLARSEIEMALRTRWGAEPTQAAKLARLSGGRIGWAIAALREPALLEQHEAAIDRCEAMATGTLADRFALAAELGGGYTKDRAGVQATLELIESWWRDILLIAAGREDQAAHRERLDRLRALASQCDVPSAVRAVRAIDEARLQLTENASPTLALEAMMLALPDRRPNAVTARLRR